MILTRNQADGIALYMDFMASNYGWGAYHAVLRPAESPAMNTPKRVTIQRKVISNQPIGDLTIAITRSGQPDEYYDSYDAFVNAYAFVTNSTMAAPDEAM